MYQVVLRKHASKVLKKLDERYRDKVFRAIHFLAMDSYLGKPLRGEFEGKYSLRVWPYRIIYKIYKNKLIVYVFSIGHRQGVYK